MVRLTVVRGSLIALALLSAGGFTASADDGRPPAPSGAVHPPTSSSIPLTELRPSQIETAPTPTMAPEFVPLTAPHRAPVRAKELVLFVGGYGSRSDDGAFDDLAARFSPDRYDVRRLGDDPRFPYDTYGGVDANAQILTDEIRSIGADYSAVNIVSHSMGGVVTDRAFANSRSFSVRSREAAARSGEASLASRRSALTAQRRRGACLRSCSSRSRRSVECSSR